MEVWQNNAFVTVLVGGVAFLVLFLPYVVWSFHRFGQLSFRRIIGWAAVCVYFTGLAVYTLVPFPEDPQAFCASTHVGYNLHPLEFITDIRTQTAGMGLRSALTSAVVLQVVFNVVLFVPLGVLLHRYFRRGAITSTLIGLIMSVCIETTQYTGFFGLLPCAYRVADVDDVITNTAGTLIGALIAPLLLFWMPASRTLTSTRLVARPVTSMRRWVGMVVDGFLFYLIAASSSIAVLVAGRLLSWWPVEAEPEWISPAGDVVALLMVFVIPSLTGRGGSLGQRVVWLTPRWPAAADSGDGSGGSVGADSSGGTVGGGWPDDAAPDGGQMGGGTYRGGSLDSGSASSGLLDSRTLANGPLWRRLARSLVVVGPLVATRVLQLFIGEPVSGALNALSTLVIVLAVVMVVPTRSHRSLSGWLTGADMVDSRSVTPTVAGPGVGGSGAADPT
ncbi:VanZ family protein [Propionibacterium freudenreichii]|uniref:VanZ family protein n=1 Tax=Propionibacterium freudenreichii TaxID=1744 RepID=UPI0005A5C8B1|nr:VanZ family protein [Propionibacterium freudenreichii]MDK9331118.1 VanZ family protein [Propionibacterium freudenreichii]CEI49807.1 vanZ-like protein, transmembrane protein [Propionibacterium freudenreichii]